MSISDELDKRAERLDKKLQSILALFLLGQLSLLMAKTAAAHAFDEAYRDFMLYFKRVNLTPREYNIQAHRIEKVLFNKKLDFENILVRRGQEKEQSEHYLRLRMWLLALGFLYSLHRQSTIELAIVLELPFVRWNTAGDDRVCERCQALEGNLYDPRGPIPPLQHPSCRCFLTLEWR